MSKSALELFSTNNTILIIAVITMILEIKLVLIGSKDAIYHAIFWGLVVLFIIIMRLYYWKKKKQISED